MSNLHIYWGELLLDAFAAAGVHHVVLSPGSRSTPLALAAARDPRLRTTVVVDERCAAFVALGQARVTGRPSLLVCTSGTAAAHYLPAVIEASEASVPMLVLTSDRPPELHGRGALQTIRQVGLYGQFVRAAWELGVPDPHPQALVGVRATAALAVQATLDPRPGPVHLNAPFRTPLEPQPRDAGEAPLEERVAALRAQTVARAVPARRLPSSELVGELAAACAASQRGLIVAGPVPVSGRLARGAVAALARRLGCAVAAEAGSQLRFAPASPAPVPLELLSGSGMPEPDLVLVLGSWPTSAAWSRVLERLPVRPWVFCEHGWADPTNRAAGVLAGEVAQSVSELVERLGPGEPRPSAWSRAWVQAAEHVAAVLAQAEGEERRRGELSELGAVRGAVGCLADGSWLALGNSLAIRAVDAFCESHGVELQVLTQRGVSGIDGNISAAAGAALAAGEPVLLITGDVAFQHDLGGLATAAAVSTPLVVVVLANRGGRIFELLPLADSGVTAQELEELFLTPQACDLELSARAFGLPARTVCTSEALVTAVREALLRPGCTVVQALLAAGDVRHRWRTLREAAARAWTRGGR